MSIKNISAYKTIGEVVKILNNVDPQNIKINAHTIRFWETQFSQIKPKIFNNSRRHYDNKSLEILKLIKFLLKSELNIKIVSDRNTDKRKNVIV